MTKHPLERAADALEAEAALRRNAPYRNAYLLAAKHYREEAKRLPDLDVETQEAQQCS